MTDTIMEEATKESSRWDDFTQGLTKFWKGYKGKLEALAVIIALILELSVFPQIGKPIWYDEARFWIVVVYAFFSSSSLSEAVTYVGNLIEKKKQVASLLDNAASLIGISTDKILKAAESIAKVTANDSKEAKEELLLSLKELSIEPGNIRSAMSRVVEKVNELENIEVPE